MVPMFGCLKRVSRLLNRSYEWAGEQVVDGVPVRCLTEPSEAMRRVLSTLRRTCWSSCQGRRRTVGHGPHGKTDS